MRSVENEKHVRSENSFRGRPVGTDEEVPRRASARLSYSGVAQLELTQEAYKALLAANATWPYPAKDDTWAKTHQALLKDLKQLHAALDAMEAAESGDVSQKTWMLSNLRAWSTSFQRHYRRSLAIEETLLFPLLAQRVPDTSKLHSPSEVPCKRLLALLGTVETHIKLRCNKKPFHMTAVKNAVLALEEASVKHFAAMEAVPLAHLRAHWTREEVKKALDKKIVDDGDNHDIGWLCARCFDTHAERDAWLHAVLQISVERRTNVAHPAAERYLRETQSKLDEIISGKHTAIVDASCCVIA